MTLLEMLLSLDITDFTKARLRRFLAGVCQEGQGTFLLGRLIEALPKGTLEAHLERGHAEIPAFFAYSPYLGGLLLKETRMLADPDAYARFRKSPFDPVLFEQDLMQALNQEGMDRQARLKVLRHSKDKAFLKIAVLDYNRSIGLERTMLFLSRLAEVLLDAALELSRKDLAPRIGYPRKKNGDGLGEKIAFCVMGLGKLGARELNYHSDIDILFAYETDEGLSASGHTPHEFFTLLAKGILGYLGEYTEDGFVYRVDTRLRPEGTKGPLVNSLRSLEISYESWGQTWERLALSKMSPAAGDRAFGQRLLHALEPFVYRKTLDYTTIQDIGHIKARIDAEVPKKPGMLELKLAHGGIREVEFIVQTLSVVHGGKNPRLRQKMTLLSIGALKTFNLIGELDAFKLTQAYTLLRRLEHTLQLKEGLQTHALPLAPEPITQVVRFAFPKLPVERVPNLKASLNEAMGTVHDIFLGIFAKTSPELEEGLLKEAMALALGTQPEGIEEFLKTKGFSNPEDALRRFSTLREGASKRQLTQRAGGLLAQILPKTIDGILKSPIPELALIHTEQFFAQIGGRASYYALFKEHPKLLELLIMLFGSSSYLSHFMLKNPAVLESLVTEDPRKPLDRGALEEMAEQELASAEDFEDAMEALRSFKNTATLRIALLDLLSELPIEDVLRLNSEVAEICLVQTSRLCIQEMQSRYPFPTKTGDVPFFAVATGTLGSQEMGYGSDIDMLFLFDEPEDVGDQEAFTAFVTRLGQRILRALTTTGRGGYLYRVDTRLRPRGRHGALVSSIARFAEFNQKEAGVFEKMSMFKARPVFGKPEVIQGRIAPLFDELLWSHPLDSEELKHGLRMRSRMETELVSPDYNGQKGFHIKWGKGGLLDAEFLVVWILLAFGAGNQGLRAHSTLEGICLLESFELMSKEDSGFLANHYRFLRMLENRVRLIHDVDVENVDFEDPRFHELMASIMQRLGHETSFVKQGAKSSLLALTRRARALYDRYTLLLQRHLQDGEPDVRRWRASWGLSKNMLKSGESGKQFGRTTTKG